MHELTGKIEGVSFSYLTGKPLLTVEVNEDKGTLLKMYDELKSADKLTIKVGKHRKKRSLDANAYFHLLVNKIAAKTNSSDDEVKRTLVVRYGTLLKDDEGNPFAAMIPATQNIFSVHPYAKCYKVKYMDGKEYRCYLLYQRTRYLDSAEMAHLIEGTISEAKILGIETKSKEEIDSLLNSWRCSE